MTQLEAERRYQYATQKLIDLKWHFRELTYQAPANSMLRSELHRLGAVTQKAIDNLLSSDDFTYDTSTFRTDIPLPASKTSGCESPQGPPEKSTTEVKA